jgi:hypothetical protein
MTIAVKAKLTPARIRKLITDARQTPGFVRHSIADEDQHGLFLVVGKRTASWTLKYRPRGLNPDGTRPAPTALVLGDRALVSPEEARAKAAELRARIADGGDPVAERALVRTREEGRRGGFRSAGGRKTRRDDRGPP